MKARQGRAFIKAYKDYGKTKGASIMMLTKREWEERLTPSQYAAAEETLFEAVDGYNGIETEYSSREVFAAILEYEGIIGYQYWLYSLIENTFGVDLHEADNMDPWYFTYGSSPNFPYNGGWTTVIAECRQDAVKKFRMKHPDKTQGIINCSDIYSIDDFRKTKMPIEGNRGSKEKEVIY